MPIGREDAAQALKAAEDAAGRASRFRGYQGASGFMILWGLVWAAMDVGYYLGPQANWVSLAADGAGIAGSIWLAVRVRRNPGASAGRSVAVALMVAGAIGLYSLGLSAIVPLQSVGQGQAVAGLSVGCAYIVLGAVQGLRVAAVGAAMIAITLCGWVYAHDQFMLWMSVAGGGGLILSGLWLRTV